MYVFKLYVQEVVTQFYIETYYIKWATTSWTYSTFRGVKTPILLSQIDIVSSHRNVFPLSRLVHGTYIYLLVSQKCYAGLKESIFFRRKKHPICDCSDLINCLKQIN